MIDSEGNIDYDKISKFSTSDYAGNYFLCFSSQWKPKTKRRINAKIVYRNIGKFANGFGFGFDAGAIYRADSGYQFGAMLRDATTTVNFWSINQKNCQQ